MSYRYVGKELDLFAAAVNWKTYTAQMLAGFVGGRVLEVGAGIGGNTRFLHNPRVCEWTCLEPDPDLARRIEERITSGGLPRRCGIVRGTTASLDDAARFDTILYLDVLEHIADDGAELTRAGRLLSPGGHLVVLAPAHQFLFSPFDAAVGHYRRYNRAMLRALTPPDCRLETTLMLDSAGLFASLANRLVLSSPLPSPRQIAIWDRLLVPISRVVDRIAGCRIGKTIVAIWRKAPRSIVDQPGG